MSWKKLAVQQEASVLAGGTHMKDQGCKPQAFFFKIRDRVINHNIWSYSRRKLCGEIPVRVDAVLFP